MLLPLALGHPAETGPAETGPAEPTPVPVGLCDCAPAEGDPHGLSCAQDGFFITEFQHVGTWMAGGGIVPLSRAVCCRPCIHDIPPSALSPAPNGEDNTPIAVISHGCHEVAPQSQDGPIACNQQDAHPHYFLAGFASAAPLRYSAIR